MEVPSVSGTRAGLVQPAPRSAGTEPGPSPFRLAPVLPPPGIQLPATAAPPGPTPPRGKRLNQRSRSKLQGGDESQFQLFPGQITLGKSRLSACDPTLQNPQRAAGLYAAHTRERRKSPPPSVVTASGHPPLTAINNLWPAATPRGLASRWPGAWKYLFREAPEREAARGGVVVGAEGGLGEVASDPAVRHTFFLPQVASRY